MIHSFLSGGEYMTSRYDSQLMEIFALIHKKAPKKDILEKARGLKIEVVEAWSDAQQTSNFLDSMIARWASDPSWISGVWMTSPMPQQAIQRFVGQPVFASSGQRTMPIATTTERVLELAKGNVKDGIVNTELIVKQLHSEGDSRSEKNISISVGNNLTSHGWKRVGRGMYRLPEQKEVKEGKATST
jgi:hypothetical protein